MSLLRRIVRGVGNRIAQAADWGLAGDHLTLLGDRDVEWAWTGAHMPPKPGRVLDLGPATSFTPLIAAFSASEVIAFDLDPPFVPFAAPTLKYQKGDILRGALPEGLFDTIINCSTTEHIGVSGRYGSVEEPDGDLRAMSLLRERMNGPNARMIFTIPLGRDATHRPFHRTYGAERLPKILAGFEIIKEAFYAKPALPNRWVPVERAFAIQVEGSASFYALGMFVLARK
jgi:Caenorhabditis protein of unknown function, DUF268